MNTTTLDVRPAVAPDAPAPGRTAPLVRHAALLEIAAFLLVALLLDSVWGGGERYAHWSPHPFWIVVLLASAYYGTREGLAAVVLASLALLLGNLPPQQVSEQADAWLLRIMLQPLQWCIAAAVLGALRDAARERQDALTDELAQARDQLRSITQAYERLHTLNQHLEERVAAQSCTVQAMYNAARAIERQGVGGVLVGVNELVRTVLHPAKFSLFLLNGELLEAAASEGWNEDDPFECDFDATSPLYEAVVARRRVLVVSHPLDQHLLGTQGMLAGPLVNAATGVVVGMLKVEAMAFIDLNRSNVQNFHVLCDWVGAALANAQHIEDLLAKVPDTGLALARGEA